MAVETLTQREYDILRLLTRGLTDAAMAGELHLTVATVRHHMDSIRRKLNCHNRVQVVLVAQARGLS